MARYRRHHRKPPLPQAQLEGTIVQDTPQRIYVKRLNGQKGGLATSRRYGQEFKEKRATMGGNALLAKYGHSYYSDHFKRIWKERKRKMAEAAKALKVGF